jgi:hypothetical protein
MYGDVGGHGCACTGATFPSAASTNASILRGADGVRGKGGARQQRRYTAIIPRARARSTEGVSLQQAHKSEDKTNRAASAGRERRADSARTRHMATRRDIIVTEDEAGCGMCDAHAKAVEAAKRSEPR